MKNLIKIFLFAFMLLGLMTSASIANTRTQGWSLKWVLGIMAAHCVLAGFAFLLAVKSKRTDAGYQIGLSPWAGYLVHH